jgi:hypothetical protein
MRDGRAQQRLSARQPRISLDIAPAHLGTKPDAVGADSNAAQPGQPAQIDQQAGRGEPKREHRHQALTAGEHLRARVRGEQGDGLI